jgi:LPXTG-site transpeptidase (sortase) family protein
MDSLFTRVWNHKFAFLGAFFVVFTLSYIVLMAIDFLPEPPTPTDAGTKVLKEEDQSDRSTVEEQEELTKSESEMQEGDESEQSLQRVALPISLSITKLDRTVSVLNPTSRTIADLDAALLTGVVRHPDSATLEQEGNVFILGHSSYLPQVFNKNFQAFNGIQNLEWGDTIEVATAEAVYEYRVEKVYRARAQDLTIPIAGTGKMLTLATCNSFGSVDDRYLVEAKQMSVRKL